MTVIYPDIEAVIVAHLQDALGDEVRVATKKVPAGDVQPDAQVIVTATYSQDKERVTRYAGIVLDCYASGDLEATDLALTAEAHLRNVTGDAIKFIEILRGNVRLPEETEQEKRSISAQAVVKAANF